MKERLKLVESFSELRAGIVIVYKPCVKCAKAHRALLLSKREAIDGIGFPMVPTPMCRQSLFNQVEWFGPGASTVAKRKIWRVIDGLEASSQTTTRTRHPKTEAAR